MIVSLFKLVAGLAVGALGQSILEGGAAVPGIFAASPSAVVCGSFGCEGALYGGSNSSTSAGGLTGAIEPPSPPSFVSVDPVSGSAVRVEVGTPSDDGGSPVSSYRVEWDTDQGVEEVQRIHVRPTVGATEVQTLTTSADDVDEVQSVHTAASRVPEVQTVTTTALAGETLGGSFALSFDGYVTADIAHDAAAAGSLASFESSIEALLNVDDVTVTRTGPDLQGGYEWSVTFHEPAADQPQLRVVRSGLTGAGASVDIDTTQHGNQLGGSFTLSFEGETTTTLDFDASEADVESALQALQGVGDVEVSRAPFTGSDAATAEGAYSWYVTFVDTQMHDGDVPALTASSAQLSGTGAAIVVCTDGETTNSTLLPAAFTGTRGGDPCNVAGSSIQGNELVGMFSFNVTDADGMSAHVANVSLNATAADMQAALHAQAADVVGHVHVARSDRRPAGGYTWTLSFTEKEGPFQLIDANSSAVELRLSEGIEGASIEAAKVSSGTYAEVHRLDISAGAPAGAFSFVFSGLRTTGTSVATGNVTLANATTCGEIAAELQDELALIAEHVGTGVSVSGDSAREPATEGCAINITYAGFAGNLPEPAIVPVSATLTLVGVQDGTARPLQPGGRFALSLAGQRTGFLPQDATAAEVRDAIELLSGVGSVEVERSTQDANFGYTWSVTFSDLVGDVPLMQGDARSLNATVAVVAVSEATKGAEPSFASGPGGLPLGSMHQAAGNTGDASPVSTGASAAFARFITALDQGVPYAVRVIALNSAGESQPAYGFPRLVTPMPQAPSAPTDVRLDASPASSSVSGVAGTPGRALGLSFNPPASDGGSGIASYKVEWMAAGTGFTPEVQEIEVTAPVQVARQQVITSASSSSRERQIVLITGDGSGASVQEEQEVRCAANGGTFRLAVDGESTGDIAWNAAASAVEQALLALDSVSGVTVAFSSGASGACSPTATPQVMTLTFAVLGVQGYAGDVPEVTFDNRALDGTRFMSVTTSVPGGAPLQGQFRLSFRGEVTEAISITASTVGNVETALESLDSIGSASAVAVTTDQGNIDSVGGVALLVSFDGLGGDLPAIQGVDDALLGNNSRIIVCQDGVEEEFFAAGGPSNPAEYLAARGLAEEDVQLCVSAATVLAAGSRAGNEVGGTFRLSFAGHVSAEIPHDAQPQELEAALEALPSVGDVAVTRSSPDSEGGYAWSVTFLSNPGAFP